MNSACHMRQDQQRQEHQEYQEHHVESYKRRQDVETRHGLEGRSIIEDERKEPLFSASIDDDDLVEEPSLAPTDESWDRSRSTSNESSPPYGNGSWDDSRENTTENTPITMSLNLPPNPKSSVVSPESQSQSKSTNPNSQSPPHPHITGFGFRPLLESLTEYFCPIESDSSSHQTSSYKYCCNNCVCLRPCLSHSSSISPASSPLICHTYLDKEVERFRRILQIEIGHLMGSSSSKAQEWLATLRNWLTCFKGTKSCRGTPPSATVIGRQLLRNRAHMRDAQIQRIRRLRNERHFVRYAFPPGSAMLGRDGYVALPTTQSLDERSLQPKCQKTTSYNGYCYVFSSARDGTDEGSMSRMFLRAMGGDCVYNSGAASFETIESFEGTQDLYYDSDPGEMRFRHRTPRRASCLDPRLTPRRRPLEETLIEEIEMDDGSVVLSLAADVEAEVDGDSSYDDLYVDVKNDEMVTRFTKELTTGNITLIWHLSTNHRSPICVQAWFEMGSRLREKVIQPKFMWWPAYQPDIANKKISLSSQIPESIELLNIVRVLKPSSIDRDQHPFAKLKNSFSLQTNTNEIFLFEAYGEKERDRFVQGLKLVVARLASKIIVGDEDVFDEFFAPWGQSLSPSGLSYTDSESCEDSIGSFGEESDESFYRTEGNEIFRASPVFNK